MKDSIAPLLLTMTEDVITYGLVPTHENHRL